MWKNLHSSWSHANGRSPCKVHSINTNNLQMSQKGSMAYRNSHTPFVLYLLVGKQDCDFYSEILKQPDNLIKLKYWITFGFLNLHWFIL